MCYVCVKMCVMCVNMCVMCVNMCVMCVRLGCNLGVLHCLACGFFQAVCASSVTATANSGRVEVCSTARLYHSYRTIDSPGHNDVL